MNSSRWNSVLSVILCWSIIMLPWPGYIMAEETAVIECSDLEGFKQQLCQLPGTQGWDTPQMQAFSKPVLTSFNQSLKRLKSEFGLDLKELSALMDGRVRATFDPTRQRVMVYAEPKQPVNIDLLIEVLKQVNNQGDITEQEIAGCKVVTVSDGRMRVAFIYNGSRFILNVGPHDQAEQLIGEYITADKPLLQPTPAEVTQAPELKGQGIISRGNGTIQIPPLPTPFNVQSMINTLNIPGAAPGVSRAFVANERMVSVAFTQQNMDMGLCSMIKKGPVSDTTLAWADTSVSSLATFHINAAAFPEIVQAVINASENPQLMPGYQGILAQVKMMIGLHLEEDIFHTFGDEMMIMIYPGHKGGGFPLFSLLGLNSGAAVAKLADSDTFKSTMQRLTPLINNLAQKDRVGGTIKTITHNGTTINYLKLFAGAISPCYAITDGYLVMTTNVPLMRHVLDSRGKDRLVDTAAFKATLAECGESPGAMFSYSQPITNEVPTFAQSLVSTQLVLAAGTVLGALALPELAKSRRYAQSTRCKNNLRQIGTALSMYIMDNGPAFPERLGQLAPDFLWEEELLYCPNAAMKHGQYHYLNGLTDTTPSDAIVAFDRKGNHARGRNILYVDAHVAFMSEEQFIQELSQNIEKFNAHYSEEALQLAEEVLSGQETAAGTDDNRSPQVKKLFDESAWQKFLFEEGIKLATAVDFAIFPSGENFTAARKSNFANVTISSEGFVTKRYTGHMFGGSSETLLVVIAVTAIGAAIAIPNIIKARAMGRGNRHPGPAITEPVPPFVEEEMF